MRDRCSGGDAPLRELPRLAPRDVGDLAPFRIATAIHAFSLEKVEVVQASSLRYIVALDVRAVRTGLTDTIPSVQTSLGKMHLFYQGNITKLSIFWILIAKKMRREDSGAGTKKGP